MPASVHRRGGRRAASRSSWSAPSSAQLPRTHRRTAALLALALAARATRLGHVCLDLRAAHDQVEAAQEDEGGTADLTLPEPGVWRADLRRRRHRPPCRSR